MLNEVMHAVQSRVDRRLIGERFREFSLQIARASTGHRSVHRRQQRRGFIGRRGFDELKAQARRRIDDQRRTRARSFRPAQYRLSTQLGEIDIFEDRSGRR